MPPPFDALGALVYARTYSRVKEDGSNEQWWETVQRVVEGTYTVQKRWIESRSLGWNAWRAQKSAQEMYDRIFNLKFVPPGRGLWVMGTPIVEEKGLAAALNNCGFVSTEDMKDDPSKPFIFLMDMSMLGVGVGFNTNGAGTVIIREPKKSAEFTYIIPDTREGWVESVRLLLDSYFHGSASVTFDYSLIRPKGSPIKTFGGTASGPGPLKDLHKNLDKLLHDNIDNPISVTMIVDIMNYIGVAVVAGNVRRTAEISFGHYDDPEYLSLKDYRWDAKSKKFVGSAAHRADRGWASNNSIYAELGMNYSKVAKQISTNGEPGLIWMHNIKNFSRMCDAPDGKDHRAAGTNPCVVGETLVAVADGRNAVPIKDLVGTTYPVYTVNSAGKVVIGKSTKTWKTREKAEVWRLVLDDGSEIVATPDHKIMLRNGDFVELRNLKRGASLMPFNSYKSGIYRQIKSNTAKANLTKQVDVYNGLKLELGREPKEHEVKNICKLNGISFRLNKNSDNPYILNNYGEFKAYAAAYNHRVASVSFYGYEDVYDMEVEKTHNFGVITSYSDEKYIVSSGVFVHNCSEQSLESQELCCVSYDTRILTKNGNPKIGDVVGEHVEVWNGEEWSSVVPFLAAKNKNLYRVTLSDGSYLDVTDDHNWSVRSQTARKYRQKNTIELNIGDYVQSFDISNDIPYGNEEEHAYKYGFFAGDGFINKSKNYKYSLCVVQSPEYEAILPELMGVEYNEQHPTGYTNPFKRVNISEHLEISICEQLRDSSTGLPDEFFSWDSKSISDFFGGWIDSDGSLREQLNTDNYILFGSELKLRDAQLLLRRIGINHATLSKWASKGDETNKGIRNKDLWALYIPTYESMHINTKLKNATRFGSRYKINNAHPNGKLIDTSRKQKIVSIEKLEGKHDTFCFNEPVNHMGVFGNVLTYQCLVETFPTKHDSMEDYLRTLKFAYLYAKTVTLLSTHWPETNRVLLRNARIGCSMSGIVQFLDKHGLNTLKLWCDNGYRTVKEWDEVYSDWLCVPKSIKVTSVKPSGTVSLLAGVTPGVHFPEHTHYIRRVNLAKDSPLVNAVTSAGYKVEDSAYDKASCVVEIPVHMDHARPASKVSIWEKAALAVFMQAYWADNQVSCTVTFDPERESGEIEKVLDLFQYDLKGISFLPSVKGGAYAQMPYEAITEEKYNELIKNIKPIDFSLLKNNKAVVDKFCDSDTCELPFKKGDK